MDPMAKKKTDEAGGLTVVLAVNVTEEMAAALDRRAYEESKPGEMVSRSEIVRRALAGYLLVGRDALERDR